MLVSTTHTIGIAEWTVIQAPDVVRTVLGSCIGVTLHDRKARVAGMAHIILPDSSQGEGKPGKFADTAIPLLLDEMLAAGAVRPRVSAKITGGARMFGSASQSDLGTRNAEAVRQVLSKLGIGVLADDCGGGKGRKVTLEAESGVLLVQVIGEEPHRL